MEKKPTLAHQDCGKEIMAIKDAMDILSGKWKVLIVGALSYKGASGFMDLRRFVGGIGAKMLSKELRDLEINLLVTRTVLNTSPITVQYELTPHGRTLEKVTKEINLWGKLHRKKITGK